MVSRRKFLTLAAGASLSYIAMRNYMSAEDAFANHGEIIVRDRISRPIERVT